MSRHEQYYQPRAVPCECGSMEAYWHGPKEGQREYCCDACWRKRTRAEARHQAAQRSRARLAASVVQIACLQCQPRQLEAIRARLRVHLGRFVDLGDYTSFRRAMGIARYAS